MSYGERDPTILNILKEQDFVQIILKMLLSLFPNREALHNFVDIRSYFEQEEKIKEEELNGSRLFPQMIASENSKPVYELIPHEQRLLYEIEMLKAKILKECYRMIKGLCDNQEINQLLFFKYLPFMQIHSFFFPELIPEISSFFCSNQEILLQLSNDMAFRTFEPLDFQVNSIPGSLLIDIVILHQECKEFCFKYFEEEKLENGGFRFFFFYLFYLLGTNSTHTQRLILEMISKVTSFQGEGLGANQDTIIRELQTNFKELISEKFFNFSFQEQNMIVGRPDNYRTDTLEVLFPPPAKRRHKNTSKVYEVDFSFEEIEKFAELIQRKLSGESESDFPEEDSQSARGEENAKLLNKVMPKQVMDKDHSHSIVSDEEPELGETLTDYQKQYLIIQMNFFASMCLDRNFTWKDYLVMKDYFNFRILVENFTRPFQTYALNASICRVMKEMFLNQPPMFKVVIPQYCKVIESKASKKKKAKMIVKLTEQMESAKPEMAQLEVESIQTKIYNYFSDLKTSLQRLPYRFDSLLDPEVYQVHKDLSLHICNEFTLEMITLIKQLVEYGQYNFKAKFSELAFFPLKLDSDLPEKNLSHLMRIMVRILDFEEDYPEFKLLLDNLRKCNKEIKAGKFGSEILAAQLKDFKYKEEYEKVIIVEDIESPDNELFQQYEAYFRQYVVKHMAFKNFFNQKNPLLVKIKLEILSLIDLNIDFILDTYLNKIKDCFQSCITSEDLDKKLAKGELLDASSVLSQRFNTLIEKNLLEIFPPVSPTGLSLDYFDERLEDNNEPGVLSFNWIYKHSLFPTLMFLFTFSKDDELLSSKSIELMIRIFNMRNQLRRMLKEVIVFEGEDSVLQLDRFQKALLRLKINCDSAENWIQSKESGQRAEVAVEVIRDLDAFCRFLSAPEEENIDNPEVHSVPEFSVKIEAQNMMRNLKAHEVAIDFLRDTFQLLEKSSELSSDPVILKYFQILFLFLRKFCYKNTRNQNLLFESISIFIQNAPLDVGQISLIIDIYSQNEELCKFKYQVVTDDMTRWISKLGRRFRIIDFFLCLLKCNDTYITENQRMVLSTFLDHPEKYTMLYCKPSKQDYPVCAVLDFELKEDIKSNFYFDQPILYHSRILKLMHYCCIGKGEVYLNEIRVKSFFRLENFVDLLLQPDTMTTNSSFESDFQPIEEDLMQEKSPRRQKMVKGTSDELKVNALWLIYSVYIETDVASKDLEGVRKKLIAFFKKETERLSQLQRGQYRALYVEYLFGLLIKLVATWEGGQLVESQEGNGSGDEKGRFNIKDFVNQFANKIDYFPKEVTQEYSEEINNLATVFNFDFGNVNQKQVENQEQSIEQKMKGNSSEVIWKFLWKTFEETMAGNERVEEHIFDEKIVLSKCFNMIEDIFKIPIISNPDIEDDIKEILINMSKKRVIKELINYLLSSYDRSDLKNTVNDILYCLGGMIPLDKNDEISDDNSAMVEREQLFLGDCGVCEMIITLLMDYHSVLVGNDYNLNLVNLAVRVLEGGNLTIQQKFFTFMKNNVHIEQFFSHIVDLFDNEIKMTNTNEISPNLLLVEKLLRMFQLLSEGHYEDMQLFLKSQDHTLRSFNMLEEIIELLASYINGRRVQYFQIILQSFSTLTELIQGPCYENQKVLVQGGLLETVSKLLNMDEFFLIQAAKEKLLPDTKGEVQYLKPTMISKIKYECSVMLSSLIESRADNANLFKMFTFLKRFIYINITNFFIHYE